MTNKEVKKKQLLIDVNHRLAKINNLENILNISKKVITIAGVGTIIISMISPLIVSDNVNVTIETPDLDICVEGQYPGYEIIFNKINGQITKELNEKAKKMYLEEIAHAMPVSYASNYEIKLIKEDGSDLELDKYSQAYIRNLLKFDSEVPITKETLKQITKINLSGFDGFFSYYSTYMDLSWINYCENLSTLYVTVTNENQIEKLNKIKKLPNLQNFKIEFVMTYENINEYSYGIPFNETNFGFLLSCKDLQKLSLDSSFISLEGEFLKKVSEKYNFDLELLQFREYSKMIDYDILESCKSIHFITNDNGGPYDIAVALSKQQFDKLISSNQDVNMTINYIDGSKKHITKSELAKALSDIYSKIASSINKVGISASDTDEEKFEKIITFVLNDLQYSKIIGDAQRNYNDFSEGSELDKLYNQLCCQGGRLSGAFGENSEVICVTYSTLIQVLCREAGLNCYIVNGNNHSWNLVKINNCYFYTDATLLDSEIIDLDNEVTSGKNYLFPAVDYGLHNAYNIPTNLEINKNENVDFNHVIEKQMKNYKIKFNNKSFVISTYALVAFLSSLGFAGITNVILKKEKLGLYLTDIPKLAEYSDNNSLKR